MVGACCSVVQQQTCIHYVRPDSRPYLPECIHHICLSLFGAPLARHLPLSNLPKASSAVQGASDATTFMALALICCAVLWCAYVCVARHGQHQHTACNHQPPGCLPAAAHWRPHISTGSIRGERMQACYCSSRVQQCLCRNVFPNKTNNQVALLSSLIWFTHSLHTSEARSWSGSGAAAFAGVVLLVVLLPWLLHGTAHCMLHVCVDLTAARKPSPLGLCWMWWSRISCCQQQRTWRHALQVGHVQVCFIQLLI